MTLGQMAAIVSQRLNEGASPTFYPKTEIVSGLNEANRLFALMTLCVERTASWSPTLTFTHMLPVFSDWLAPLRLSLSTGAKVRPARWSELWSLDSAWPVANGTPKRYVHSGADLVTIYPLIAGTLTWHYAAAPLSMVADGDIPEIPPQFHEVLPKYAIYRARMVEGGVPFAGVLPLFTEFLDAATAYAGYVRARNIGAGYDTLPPELALFDRSRLKVLAVKSK